MKSTIGAPQTTAAPPRERGDRLPYKWRALLAVSVGTIVAVLDMNMLNVALPTITESFNTDLATVRWVVIAYQATITSLLIALGRLSDLWGRKRVYVAGFAIFTLGAGLCALVGSMEQFVLFRILQGVGAAAMMAISPAIITSSFPPTERGKALGLNTLVVASAGMLGPTIGGLLIDLIDWRATFYLRVPIGLVGIVLAQAVLQERQDSAAKERFDVVGAVVLSATVTALVLALGSPASASAVPLLLATLAGMAVFVVLQRRAVHPLVDLGLFRIRMFSAASASSLFSFMAAYAVVLLMPFYLQQVLGYRPTEVGMVLLASPLMMAIMAPLSGWLSDRIGSRVLSPLGLAVICLGLVSLSQLHLGAGRLEVVTRLAFLGLGQGLFQSPNNSAIMGSVPRARLGFAASMLASMRNLGMVVGTALSSTIFTARLADYAGGAAPTPSAFVAAMHDTLLVAAAIASIGVVASLTRGQQQRQ